MKKIKAVVIKLSEKSVFFRNIVRKIVGAIRKIRYKLNTLGEKVHNKVIIFCSFDGKSYSCRPKAIYEYMIQHEKYKEFKFVWAFKEVEKYSFLKANRNTIIVKINSREYQKYLAISKY